MLILQNGWTLPKLCSLAIVIEEAAIFVFLFGQIKKHNEKFGRFKKMPYLCTHFQRKVLKVTIGEMVEWSITVVLKTTVPRGTGGSNPSLSAIEYRKPLSAQALEGFFHDESAGKDV